MSPRGGKIFVLACGALALAGLVVAGLGRYIPYEQLLASRLHALANESAHRESKEIEQKLGDHPDAAALRQAAAQSQAIRAEHEANDFAIEHQVKSCPADYQHGDDKFSFDVSQCDPGQFTRIVLPEKYKYKEEVYAVNMYKYGQGGKLIRVVAMPVIRLVREQDPDGFSEAQLVSGPNDALSVQYRLRGDVRFVPQGDADYVEFVLRR